VTFSIDPATIATPLQDAYQRLIQAQFARALWDRRLDVWSEDADIQQKIGNRLGWLEVIDFSTAHFDRLQTFVYWLKQEPFTDIVLFGMGGSSLAPEVLRRVMGVAPGHPRFRVLDSVDPESVRDALENAATSLFIVASKSGTTIEPNVMAAEAQRRVRAAGIDKVGSRFIAITDEGTALHQRAIAEDFRDVFINPSDIGGRYSALSLFGLVPAALMGIDLNALISPVRRMAAACQHADPQANPGLALGAVMASAAMTGRDKLTLLLPPRLESVGLWIEQLVAESTGKHGKGVVPIAGESPDAPLGDDRLVIKVVLHDDARPAVTSEPAQRANAPQVTLEMPDAMALGAEFFRWEFATATAGFLLDINPFDEPNVQQAKDATRALLDTYKTDHRLPIPEPHAAREGVRLTLSAAAQDALDGNDAASFLRVLGRGDYFALLAYLPAGNEDLASVLQSFRSEVGRRSGCATMLGYGPRYLHSTGQLHKGGPNTGVFVIVTGQPDGNLEIPGEPYTFDVLETAQALGDFESLDRASRRTLYVHLPTRAAALLRKTTDLLLTR
jgi:glucose-6-phosphate isomerase